MRRRFLHTSALLTVASLLILFAVGGAAAQSGRRAPKPISPSPVPTPSPEPEKRSPPKTPAQPQIPLLVLSDISQSMYLSYSFDRVQSWVVQRLRDSSALAVTEGERTSRREAIKRAKASSTGFVIFLTVEESRLDTSASRSGRESENEVTVSYAIFAPVTGQTKASGTAYMNQRSSTIGIGRVRVGMSCYPNVRSDEEYQLLQASLEVAGRIMSALNVPAPPLCR